METDREPPGNRGVDVRQTIVYPVGNAGTDGDHGGLDAGEKTSVVRLGALGDPGRDGRCVGAVSETGNNSSDHKLQETVLARDGRDLDDGTEAHDLRKKARVRTIISGESEKTRQRTPDPSQIIFRRPRGSAMKKAASAPKKHPTS